MFCLVEMVGGGGRLKVVHVQVKAMAKVVVEVAEFLVCRIRGRLLGGMENQVWV